MRLKWTNQCRWHRTQGKCLTITAVMITPVRGQEATHVRTQKHKGEWCVSRIVSSIQEWLREVDSGGSAKVLYCQMKLNLYVWARKNRQNILQVGHLSTLPLNSGGSGCCVEKVGKPVGKVPWDCGLGLRRSWIDDSGDGDDFLSAGSPRWTLRPRLGHRLGEVPKKHRWGKGK